MELRDIEIFLTLAEELHFGRTAELLRVSQARVSQAIRKQERRIGATLFDRTSRTVTLTPIGRRLRDDLQQAYDLLQGGLARATAAGQGIGGTLRLGVMGALGAELRPVVEAFRARHPDGDVEISEFHFSDPFTRLRSGDVDVQLMWLPVREPDLTVGPVVLTEGRVLAVSTDSDLAGRDAVSMNDLGGRTVLDPGADMPDYWLEAMLPKRTPEGRLIPRGPAARTFHEVLTRVAAGQLVCPLNEHVRWYYSHPGITYLPIRDAPRTEWALVWSTANRSAHLRALIETVGGGEPRPIVPGP
ncbi:LysR family transcriptional regulator [Longispora fulva]|uniref:DNA-binding transcriptional LysR family regulator n=1 Tax=Longispora fulva TaxID=619741 RepID=A0A8J7GF59_9ACTN|nr:LysR family transcriptional regulator [Longispora fulva]MBG6136765.1 DNA-binding transcriptional LysR family regulator [Longispora fulva]GIG59936.1 LysR family transcriptional regulator [Longispora fulva]